MIYRFMCDNLDYDSFDIDLILVNGEGKASTKDNSGTGSHIVFTGKRVSHGSECVWFFVGDNGDKIIVNTDDGELFGAYYYVAEESEFISGELRRLECKD